MLWKLQGSSRRQTSHYECIWKQHFWRYRYTEWQRSLIKIKIAMGNSRNNCHLRRNTRGSTLLGLRFKRTSAVLSSVKRMSTRLQSDRTFWITSWDRSSETELFPLTMIETLKQTYWQYDIWLHGCHQQREQYSWIQCSLDASQQARNCLYAS